MAKCQGTTQSDKPCRNNEVLDGYCRVHHPDRIDGIPGLETQTPPLEVREGVPNPDAPACPACDESCSLIMDAQPTGITLYRCTACEHRWTE